MIEGPPNQAAEPGKSLWLISFTDVVALMLTFFVLIFSMSEPIRNTVSEDINALQANANTARGAPEFSGQAERVDLFKDQRVEGLNLTYLETLLRESLTTLLEEEPRLSGIKLQRHNGMLVIRIPDKVYNRQGVLVPLARMLNRLRNDIAVWTPVNAGKGDYMKAMRKGHNLVTRLESGGYEQPVLLKTFSSFYAKGLSAELHIAIMETNAVL